MTSVYKAAIDASIKNLPAFDENLIEQNFILSFHSNVPKDIIALYALKLQKEIDNQNLKYLVSDYLKNLPDVLALYEKLYKPYFAIKRINSINNII